MTLQRTVPEGAKLLSKSLLGVVYSFPTVTYASYPDAIELQHFCVEFRRRAKRMRFDKLVEWALAEIGEDTSSGPGDGKK